MTIAFKNCFATQNCFQFETQNYKFCNLIFTTRFYSRKVMKLDVAIYLNGKLISRTLIKKENRMSEIGKIMSQYATSETMTVVAFFVLLALGWKLAAGTKNVFGSLAKKASYAGMMSTLMISLGLGSMGLGIGEIGGRDSATSENGIPHVGFTNSELMEMAENGEINTDNLQMIIDYARTRDGHVTPLDEMEVYQLISSLENPKAIEMLTKLYEGRKARVDEQYATLTAKPEVKTEKTAYEETTLVAKTGEAETKDPFVMPEGEIVAVDEAKIGNPDSLVSLPVAWGMTLFGAAFSLAGFGVFATRNNRRNTDDPHHPNHPSQQVA